MSVVRGGKALLRKRRNLAAAGLTEERWRREWESARLFLTADGEKDKAWGNETIRWNPDAGWLEIKLPGPLARLANQPHGRYRLSCPVRFSYRGNEVAAQAATGAIRYDISHDPVRGRWYIDASWKVAPAPAPSLDQLRAAPVLAADLNNGHLAAWALTPDGNPAGPPVTIPVDLAGLPASQRDGRLRAAISSLTRLARLRGCRAIVIEDLDFTDAREQGREQLWQPTRARSARAGLPAAGRGHPHRKVPGPPHPDGRQRRHLGDLDRPGLYLPLGPRALAHPTAGAGFPDPRQRPPRGRGGDRQACARPPGAATGRRDRRRPEDQPPESCPRAPMARQTTRDGRPREAKRQPPQWRKTATADRTRPPDQATQDRSGPRASQDYLSLAQ